MNPTATRTFRKGHLVGKQADLGAVVLLHADVIHIALHSFSFCSSPRTTNVIRRFADVTSNPRS